MIGFILFIALLVYVGFILKKRYLDRDPLYRKKRFKWIAYSWLFVLVMWSAFGKENSKGLEAQKQRLADKKTATENAKRISAVDECSLKMNTQLQSVTIKSYVARFASNKNTPQLMVFAHNSYIHLHKQEKKQVRQMIDSLMGSFCGEKYYFSIYDQLGNDL